MTVFSRIRAAATRFSCTRPSDDFDRRVSWSSSEIKGGFEQRVHIRSCEPGSNIVKYGNVLIDPCNKGPNLVTEKTIRDINSQPRGEGVIIRTYDGNETVTGGEVELCFSAPSESRYHTKTFHCVPDIIDGIDMVLNYDFYVENYRDKVPGMLMIRFGDDNNNNKKNKKKKKETKGNNYY